MDDVGLGRPVPCFWAGFDHDGSHVTGLEFEQLFVAKSGHGLQEYADEIGRHVVDRGLDIDVLIGSRNKAERIHGTAFFTHLERKRPLLFLDRNLAHGRPEAVGLEFRALDLSGPSQPLHSVEQAEHLGVVPSILVGLDHVPPLWAFDWLGRVEVLVFVVCSLPGENNVVLIGRHELDLNHVDRTEKFEDFALFPLKFAAGTRFRLAQPHPNAQSADQDEEHQGGHPRAVLSHVIGLDGG